MRFRIRFADQLVGVFLLVAVLGVAVILGFIGVNQRWFARNYRFRSRFESGGGLSVGMPIMLKGFEVGKIASVALNDANQVDVEFTIQDTYYPKVLPNSVLQLTSSPIGLGTTLNFLPGIPSAGREAPLPEGSFVYSLDLPEGRQLVEEGKVAIPKGEDVIGSVIAKVNPILDEVNSTLGQIRRVVGTVDLALQGTGGPAGEMVAGLAQVPTRVNGLIDDVNVRVADITDQVNAVMDQVDGVLRKIDTASTNIVGITEQTQDTVGSLTKSLTDTTAEAQTTIADLDAEMKAISTQVQGTIGNLSTDLDVITANLQKTTEELSNTQGLVTRLLDPKGSVATILDDNGELYGQIEQSVAGVNKAVDGLNAILAQVSEFVDFVNSTRPQISGLLETGKATLGEGNQVLEAVKNNPLLRGGVPEQKEQQATLKSYRDEDF
jgi:phospholipid/cholesterol/gamma-HCH transport system substrate-binding protein